MFCACVCMDVSKRFCVAGRTVFFVLASGRRQFERGLQLFSFSSCISLFIFGMRVQTRNVLQLGCQPLFQIGNQTQFFVFQ